MSKKTNRWRINNVALYIDICKSVSWTPYLNPCSKLSTLLPFNTCPIFPVCQAAVFTKFDVKVYYRNVVFFSRNFLIMQCQILANAQILEMRWIGHFWWRFQTFWLYLLVIVFASIFSRYLYNAWGPTAGYTLCILCDAVYKPGPLYIKRTNVLPQELTAALPRCMSKFRAIQIIKTSNLAASRDIA